ncbi:alpha-galactosidase A [Xylariaceae sp. FL1019]|nr:alpha-galactosidase A [Xylariaceae sp. FL1019]
MSTTTETITETTTTSQQVEPLILSMDVVDDDSLESEYRLRIGDNVKYLVISPGTFDKNTLFFPLKSLPHLPYNEDWTVAHISRHHTTGDLRYSTVKLCMIGIFQWHSRRVNCLELVKTSDITATTFEVFSNLVPSPHSAIAKIARFEWEVPRLERETRAYQLLEGSEIAPRFLAHIHENGRIMGLLLEKIQGRAAVSGDLGICKAALGRLHELGHVHGDLSKRSFVVTDSGVKLIGFGCLWENAPPESMSDELQKLRSILAG